MKPQGKRILNATHNSYEGMYSEHGKDRRNRSLASSTTRLCEYAFEEVRASANRESTLVSEGVLGSRESVVIGWEFLEDFFGGREEKEMIEGKR